MLVAVMFKVRTGHLARIAVLTESADSLQVGSVSLTIATFSAQNRLVSGSTFETR